MESLMRRLCTEPPFTCASCEGPIAGTPVFHVGLPFCCAGCVAGGPCLCTYEEEIHDDHRAVHSHHERGRAPVADDPRRLAGAAR
jgi:hypothetical protein